MAERHTAVIDDPRVIIGNLREFTSFKIADDIVHFARLLGLRIPAQGEIDVDQVIQHTQNLMTDLMHGSEDLRIAPDNPLVGQPEEYYTELFGYLPRIGFIAFSDEVAEPLKKRVVEILKENDPSLEEEALDSAEEIDRGRIKETLVAIDVRRKILDPLNQTVFSIDWERLGLNEMDVVTSYGNALTTVIAGTSKYELGILNETDPKGHEILEALPPERKYEIEGGDWLATRHESIRPRDATAVADYLTWAVPAMIAMRNNLDPDLVGSVFRQVPVYRFAVHRYRNMQQRTSL